jgi:hypothetical protein
MSPEAAAAIAVSGFAFGLIQAIAAIRQLRQKN